MTVEIFEVGGSIRDFVMGEPTPLMRERDFCAACSGGWVEMLAWCEVNMGRCFVERQEFFTVRGAVGGHVINLALCQKDRPSSDGRLPDDLEFGTLEDDLASRDFTVNALAMAVDASTLVRRGEVIDLFDGVNHANMRVLRMIGSAEKKCSEDGLRILRALRFWITKGLVPDDELMAMFHSSKWSKWVKETVSVERIQEEVDKCFAFDTKRSIKVFASLDDSFMNAIFGGDFWLSVNGRKKRVLSLR